MTSANRARQRPIVPMVTCAMAQPFVSAALRYGLDVDALLEPSGLKLGIVRAGTELMAAQHWYDLMEAVAKGTKNPTLGFQIGRQHALEELPNLRPLRTELATLGDLLTTLVIEASTLTSLADYELCVRGTHARLQSTRNFTPSRPPRQADGYFSGFIVRLAQACAGADWQAKAFTAETFDPACIPQDADGGIVRKRKAATGAVFTFPATWLLYRFNAEQSQSFSDESAREWSFMNILDRTLELHLDDPSLDFALLAGLLAKQPRELKSVLADHDTTFRKELEQRRRRRAEMLLTGTDLSSAAIGAHVGMPDPSAFARAFKRWTGMSPIAFREAGHAKERA